MMNGLVKKLGLLLGLGMMLGSQAGFAQTAESRIEPYRVDGNDKELIEKLTVLRTSKQLLSMAEVEQGLAKPSGAKVTLPAISKTVLKPAEVATKARQALVRIRWLYLCNKCNNWHTRGADGYAIAEGGVVATCYHCLDTDKLEMREGYVYASDSAGNVYPVKEIIAADEKLDAAIVRVEGGKFPPLALNDQTEQGETAYLLSDPMEVGGYFSAGMINRFYWTNGSDPGDPTVLAGARNLRIQMSTDWAPGSSGGAVLDECGNVMGHVGKISTLDQVPVQAVVPGSGGAPTRVPSTTAPATGPATSPATAPATGRAASNRYYKSSTYVVLHEAVPARGVKLLAEGAGN